MNIFERPGAPEAKPEPDRESAQPQRKLKAIAGLLAGEPPPPTRSAEKTRLPASALFRWGAYAASATAVVSVLLVAILVPQAAIDWSVSSASLVFLALLGAVAARTGGAPMVKGALRTLFWGAFAMAVTAGIGTLFGAVV